MRSRARYEEYATTVDHNHLRMCIHVLWTPVRSEVHAYRERERERARERERDRDRERERDR